MCMNEWKMIQLPRTVYASRNDFKNNEITSTQVLEWMSLFCDEFAKIGLKLIS